MDELVDRQQLDGGHAERAEVVDGHGVGQPGVGAPQQLGDVGVGGGEPLDVDLVDDRLVQRDVGRAVGAPVEVGADHHALGDVGGAVDVVAAGGVAEVVGEAGRVPVDAAVDRLGVGVEQQLVGVAALPGAGVPRTVDPEAVALADADAGQVGVPAEAVDLGHGHPGLGAVGVEQAQLDRRPRPPRTARSWCRCRRRWPPGDRAARPDLDVVAHALLPGLGVPPKGQG